jgi:hypothetical protein
MDTRISRKLQAIARIRQRSDEAWAYIDTTTARATSVLELSG